MKTQTAFIGAKSTVEADSKTAIDLYLAVIVLPGDTENNLSFWFANTLDNFLFGIFWVSVQNGLKSVNHLFNRLMKLGLTWISCDHLIIDCIELMFHRIIHVFTFPG